MTTIIVCGSSRVVYTDSQGTNTPANTAAINYVSTKKAGYLNDKSVVAGSGKLSLLNRVLSVRSKLCLPKYYSGETNTTIIHVTPRENGVIVNCYRPDYMSLSILDKLVFSLGIGCTKYSVETFRVYDGQHYTLGSGCEYAKGILKCGKTPEETIKLVSQLDNYTDNNVVSYPLNM